MASVVPIGSRPKRPPPEEPLIFDHLLHYADNEYECDDAEAGKADASANVPSCHRPNPETRVRTHSTRVPSSFLRRVESFPDPVELGPHERRDTIPHVDVTRDVNGDDRDDLIVPDSDGFWVFTQRVGGVFADPVELGPSLEMPWTDKTNPWLQSLLQEVDSDRDGRTDLVFWNKDHFEVHLRAP